MRSLTNKRETMIFNTSGGAMYIVDTRMRAAAKRLLEMSERVLGDEASLADRYSYINLMLSQWGDQIDLGLRARLRLSCYEALFQKK